MTNHSVSETDLDDMLVLTVNVFRVVFQHEIGHSNDRDFAEYIVATSVAEAAVIAEAISDYLETPIGLIETLGPIYVSPHAKIKIESD